MFIKHRQAASMLYVAWVYTVLVSLTRFFCTRYKQLATFNIKCYFGKLWMEYFLCAWMKLNNFNNALSFLAHTGWEDAVKGACSTKVSLGDMRTTGGNITTTSNTTYYYYYYYITLIIIIVVIILTIILSLLFLWALILLWAHLKTILSAILLS